MKHKSIKFIGRLNGQIDNIIEVPNNKYHNSHGTFRMIKKFMTHYQDLKVSAEKVYR